MDVTQSSSCEKSQQRGVTSGIYGGGPIYKDGSTAIPNLKASGFNEVIIWNVSISSTGDLSLNYEFPLVANGHYIGNETHPSFQEDIASLKVAPSSVTRLTFSIGSSNFGVFQAVKALIDTQGTGPESILYQNFQTLRAAFPSIDAIDFDDENCYDADSMISFAVMLGNLGFEVSLCPYENSGFWVNVASKVNHERPGTVTAVHLQCYSGGAGQSPCVTWNFESVPVYPGLSNTSSSPTGVSSTMSAWRQNCGISGGFIWLYDHFYADLKVTQLYADAINQLSLNHSLQALS